MSLEGKQIVMQIPEFKAGNIPITHAASILGKDSQFVREAMKRGILDLGACYQKEGSSHYDFYISAFKLWLLSGYVYSDYETEERLMQERKEAKKNK